jgi:methylated-DNA-protein-cysteine methyltransferase-like protein
MSFFDDVYEVVKNVPKGSVISYGGVAALCGRPKAARQVGWALHVNPDPAHIPCHRVVTKDGKCSAAFAFGGENAQAGMLADEGIGFIEGRVDMEKYGV